MLIRKCITAYESRPIVKKVEICHEEIGLCEDQIEEESITYSYS